MDRPWGIVVAAVLAWVTVAYSPWTRLDASASARLRRSLSGEGPPAVAVTVDPADATLVSAVMEKAIAAGARAVEGPAPSRGPVGRGGSFDADVPEIDGAALVRGDVPEELLAGRTVIVDSPPYARARTLAAVSGLAPTPAPLGRAIALLAALLCAAIAWAAARDRHGLGVGLVLASLAGVAGAAAGMARHGIILGSVELATVMLAAWLIGRLDGARLLGRLVDRLARPILRAAPPPPPLAAFGPELADLIGARSLLLLEAKGKSVEVAHACRWRLRLRDEDGAGMPLDPRRPPFRGQGGIARVAPVGELLDPPEPGARLFPVGDGAWLLAVFDDPSAIDRCPTAVAALCHAMGRAVRARRARGDELLMAAVSALEAESAALSTAFAEARSGLLLATAAGVTRWKNPRFEEVLAHVHPQLSGDLPRVVALARRPDETLFEALERLLATHEATRVPVPGHGLVATVTPLRPHVGAPATGLLVEVDALDAISASALHPARAERALTH